MNEKTPIMMLQEYMQKIGKCPLYVFMGSDGKMFKYKTEAENHSAIGVGRTKKTAQQNSAKLVLEKIRQVEKPNTPPAEAASEEDDVNWENNISNLQELCAKRGLDLPVYTEISESGPAHSKKFTVQCSLGEMKFSAVGRTKKIAKQLAAGKILDYYSNNVPIRNFSSENKKKFTLLNDIALAKFSELTTQWNSQTNCNKDIPNYHYGLISSIDKDTCEKVLTLLLNKDSDPIDTIEKVLNIMSLAFDWSNLNSNFSMKIIILQVWKTVPPICIMSMGKTNYDAKINTAKEAINHFITLLSL